MIKKYTRFGKKGVFEIEPIVYLCKREKHNARIYIMKLHTTIFSYLLLFSVSSFAQNITSKKIPVSDQLPVNAIHRVFQDSEGYMWYGTVDGLCRDDGYTVQVFRSGAENCGVMNSNHILCLTEDTLGRIWFGTQKGAYILDKFTYKITRFEDTRLNDKEIINLHATPDGSVWICIVGVLFRFSTDGTEINSYPIRAHGASGTIHSLIQTADNDIIISLWQEGIYKLDKETDTFVPFPPAPKGNFTNCIIRDKDHPYYWLGTKNDGVVRFDPNASPDSMYIYQTLPVNSKNEEDKFVLYMVQDDIYGYLWVTMSTDLFVFEITENGMLRQLDTSSFLMPGNKMLNEVIKDNVGNLWVSAFDVSSFIIDFKSNTPQGYSIPDLRRKTRGNPAIMVLTRDEKGVFWFLQERVGLCIYDAETDRLKMYSECEATKDVKFETISQLTKSKKKDRIWVGESTPRIYAMNQTDLDMKVLETVDLTGLTPSSGTVTALYEDNSEKLWIGTTLALFVYDINKKELKQVKDEIGKVSDIISTNDGTIWAGTEQKGLYRISADGVCDHFPVAKDIISIDATTDGKIWIGTKGGEVLCYHPAEKTIHDYTTRSGMEYNMINHIVVDVYNHVWICNNQKLTEFNPENGSYRTYMASNENILLNRFLPGAVIKSKTGPIFFGGIPGFISVMPSQHLKSIPVPVKTHITNIKTMGKSLIFDDKAVENSLSYVEIDSDERNLEIEFSSLNHRNSQQIRYAYRLNGVDNDWIYLPNGKNSAFYNHLEKGNYVFEVKATDENGLWSNEITSLTIRRNPALYETWWAETLYAIIAVAIIWSMIFLYLLRVKHDNEKKITERVAQMKLRYFTNISHDLLTPLTIISCAVDELKTTSESDKFNIRLLQANVSRLKRLLQQVLDFRKIEHGKMNLNLSFGNVNSFVKDICLYGFTQLSRKKNIDLEFKSDASVIEGYFDKDKIDKILYNLLSNAIKYTPEGKKVWVEVNTVTNGEHTSVRINVGDEGVGISKKEIAHIFTRFYNNRSNESGLSNGIGLSLTKELTELHHGTISVQSEPGVGTVFSVEIPIDKNSYNPSELPSPREVIPSGMPAEAIENNNLTDVRNLLIVEDNEDLLYFLKNMLSKKYHVTIASDGKAALDIVNSEANIDIIISDIMMPGINGIELCRVLKQDIHTSHIPILLLTAKTHSEERVESYKAGADGYITKPFEIEVLIARIDNLLLKQQNQQQEYKNNVNIKISNLKFASLDEQFLEKAIHIVESNLTEPDFDVVKLAEFVNMSRSTLSRKIKSITGLTPLEFIRNIKMKHACKLLQNKDMNIGEIALTLGYFNRKYFTQCFKEEFGVTPTDYQKSNEKDS